MRTQWLRRASFRFLGVILMGCLGCDVSSLGKIAYVKEDSLWVKGLPDGQAQRIASGLPCREPRWSPSGKWLAYTRDTSQVLLTRPSDNASRVLHQALPVTRFAWSPKEDRLVYLASGVLWSITPEQPAPILLATHKLEDGEIQEFVWEAEGAWLVYSCIVPSQENAQHFAWKQEIWRLSPSDRERERVLETTPDSEARPGFPQLAGAPRKGAPLLFWRGKEVSASLLADGAPLYALFLPGEEPRKLSEEMLVFDDFLSHHAAKGFLVVVEGGRRETWANKTLVRIDPAAGTHSVLTAPVTAALSPQVSPDGTHIAYVAAPQCGSDPPCGSHEATTVALPQRKIWLMRNDGSNKHALTNDPAYRDERPLWSNKGTHLLFARVDSLNRASLWLMASDGTGLRQVVNELGANKESEPWKGYYGHVRWEETFDWWQSSPERGRQWARHFFVPGIGLVLVALACAAFLRWHYRHQNRRTHL